MCCGVENCPVLTGRVWGARVRRDLDAGEWTGQKTPEMLQEMATALLQPWYPQWLERLLKKGKKRGFYFFFVWFWPGHEACGILIPWLGVEPVPLAVKVWNPSHWTTREFPGRGFWYKPGNPFSRDRKQWEAGPLGIRPLSRAPVGPSGHLPLSAPTLTLEGLNSFGSWWLIYVPTWLGHRVPRCLVIAFWVCLWGCFCNIWRLSKADCSPSMGECHLIRWKHRQNQKAGLPLSWRVLPPNSLLTETSSLSGFQACWPLDGNYSWALLVLRPLDSDWNWSISSCGVQFYIVNLSLSPFLSNQSCFSGEPLLYWWI